MTLIKSKRCKRPEKGDETHWEFEVQKLRGCDHTI